MSGIPLMGVDPLRLVVTPLDALGYSTYGLFNPGATEPYCVGHTWQSLQGRLARGLLAQRVDVDPAVAFGVVAAFEDYVFGELAERTGAISTV